MLSVWKGTVWASMEYSVMSTDWCEGRLGGVQAANSGETCECNWQTFWKPTNHQSDYIHHNNTSYGSHNACVHNS